MKKSYSLALGGGAAKGLIHIGVYKYLQEKNFEINEVSGTSMGAIIASLISIGMSYKDILKFTKSINYYKILDFDLKLGIIKGEKITKLFYDVFGDLKIENTKIPLKIIATDINNGSLKVFDSGKIVDALRASFAIPGIFSPASINNTFYVDGGVMMNLPIQVLSGKNIIAVSTLKIDYNSIIKTKRIFGFKIKSGVLENNFNILYRSLILLMKTNEDMSISTLGKNIKVIRPSFDGLDVLDFNKVNDFCNIGYKKASEIL